MLDYTIRAMRRMLSRVAQRAGKPRRRRVLPRLPRVELLEDRVMLDALPWLDPETLVYEENTTSDLSYTIVDTGQTTCYGNTAAISAPAEGEAFYGQDAQVDGNQPSYTVSNDGLSVLDNVTGLTWTQSPDLDGDGDIDVDDKLTFAEALTYADATLNAQSFGGYSDWRLPSMKELYSLMDFRGTDPIVTSTDTSQLTPFIDTDYFDFGYGDIANGERIIDAQFWSSNAYVGTVFGDQSAAFGLNLADGRIKGYPTGTSGPMTKLNYVFFVRGDTDYGVNEFVDNADGTITDNATRLMWSQDDSGDGMNWEDALAWVQQKNDENYLGHSDWRLPNAKELQSIVDYSRSPYTTGSAAIDPVFDCTAITNEAGQPDYGFYWTGTTHVRAGGYAEAAAYVAFGRGLGSMDGVTVIDVHGAGCQRSDPKDGDPNDYPSWGNGPQGDVQRVLNFVRLVRDTEVSAVFDGYTLLAPLGSQDTYLIDNDGTVVQSWSSDYGPALSAYLLEDGTLMRTASLTGASQSFAGGGAGGCVEQWSWDTELLWEYEYSGTGYCQHHDIEVLPNGNVLMIAWEVVDQADAIAVGRDPSLLADGELWPDHIIEVEPTGSSGGNIVWEWHAWDHLVQDYDASKDNYAVVADHPELIDVNYVSGQAGADWTHINSIDYNAELDQILLSVRNFSEIWIIDHSMTTAEAAGHSGGASGSGGDLLYRWGNPQTYDAGTAADQELFSQHDAEWIDDQIPGAGNILVFNNGDQAAGRAYSSVDEIDTPLATDGSYTLVASQPYGPDELVWSYVADPATDFFADHISGSQRLANGNTLITDGTGGIVFEVTTTGEVLWQYDVGGEIFRADRYATSYPGFDGTPLDDELPQETSFALSGPTSGVYTEGETVTIQWSAANVVSGSSISLCYDEDTTWWNGNEHWIEVDQVTAANGSGSYDWNTANASAGSYYVGGYLYDGAGGFTLSHLTDAIQIQEGQRPSFALTAPTTGTYTAGDTISIQWQAANVAAGSTISLCYDADTTWWNGNEHWIEVDQVTATDGNGSYDWNTANVSTGTYYVGGYLYDGVGGFMLSHLTDAIQIQDDQRPSFALTAPTTGTYTAGDTISIQWQAANVAAGSTISLCYDEDTTWWNGNEHWIEVDQVTAIDGNGSYDWNTANVSTGTYYVGGYLYDGAGGFSLSHLAGAIQIQEGQGQSFTLIAPTTGTYTAGDAISIQWQAANVVSGSTISLCYDEDTILWNGNEHWIEVDQVTATDGNGSYDWNTVNVNAGTYYVGGYLYDGAGNFTFSHLTDAIQMQAGQSQSFELIAPTTGTCTVGDSISIQWQAANVVAGSTVSLCYDEDTTWWNGNEHWIEVDQVTAADGNGSYDWNTTGTAAGSYYLAGYLFDSATTFTFSHLSETVSLIVASSPLQLDAAWVNSSDDGSTTPMPGTPALTLSSLQPVLDQAVAGWTRVLTTAQQRQTLRSVCVLITDLPGAQLGAATSDTIYVDSNAAGIGWFVDETPNRNEEFRPINGELHSLDPEVIDQIDLLTVLHHELGHILGLDDIESPTTLLMNDSLQPGVRREPTLVPGDVS